MTTMRSAAGRTARLVQLAMLALVAACLIGLGVQLAHGISQQGKFTIASSPNTPGSYADYSIGNFRVQNRETVTGYTLTFPSDTDATGATSPGVGDVVTVSADGKTVTVVLGTPVVGPGALVIALGNVRNPASNGTYNFAPITFHRLNESDQVLDVSGEDLVISPPPYLSMTIATPDASQTVNFGDIEPDLTTPAKTVSVVVDSGASYSLTRTIAGDGTLLGLAVNGTASGANLPPGPSTYADQYTATPPWTTDPGVLLTATVTYTVVQY